MYLLSIWLLNYKIGISYFFFYKLIIYCYFVFLGMYWLVVKNRVIFFIRVLMLYLIEENKKEKL